MAIRTRQLRYDVLLAGTAITLVTVAGLATFAGWSARRALEREASARANEVAVRVSALATTFIQERQRALLLLAESPMLRHAALDARQRARDVEGLPIPTLERIFRAHRELSADAELRAYLTQTAARTGFAELFFTDDRGFVVLATEGTSDFVQSDEGWWQSAFTGQMYKGEATYDSSAAALSIEYAVAIPGVARNRNAGVLKGVLGLDQLTWLLSGSDLGDQAYLQLVDDHGHLLATPDPNDVLKHVDVDSTMLRPDTTINRVVATERGPELVAAVPALGNEWWVLFRQPTSAAYALARSAQRLVWISGIVLVGVVVGVLFRLGAWLNQRVTDPVRAAGRIASQVASGDLSATLVTHRSEASEVAELLSAVHSMVVALRRLVGAIRQAADEAAAMAAEISAATQEMSAGTEEMTATTQDLSRKAAEQAQLVRSAADDAGQILQITSILASGSEEAARRNAAVAGLARRNKELLDQSTAQLTKLTEDVDKGAAEADALAKASQDIQKFVAQAKAVATQTNMLALNAAIEAARAGPQGRGFAVVADEVRKLASQAAVSAGDTADTVHGVLTRVQATRDRLLRLAKGGQAAREAATTAAQGLATVAGEADANDAWSREIATSATEVKRLVEEIASRLSEVAHGTEHLLASAEEIAASSQEQSASNQEIASSANQLAEAADKLQGAVKTFRLLQDEGVDETRQAAD